MASLTDSGSGTDSTQTSNEGAKTNSDSSSRDETLKSNDVASSDENTVEPITRVLVPATPAEGDAVEILSGSPQHNGKKGTVAKVAKNSGNIKSIK